MTGLYPDAPEVGDVRFSDAAGRLLAAARGESDRLGHEYIGTEHVVLGGAGDGRGAAPRRPRARSALTIAGRSGAPPPCLRGNSVPAAQADEAPAAVGA